MREKMVSLNQQQWEEVQHTRQRWLDCASVVGDIQKGLEAIGDLRCMAGAERVPGYVFDSPVTAVLGIESIRRLSDHKKGLGDSLGDSLRGSSWDSSVLACGESESYWIAFYKYCGTLPLLVPYTEESKKKLSAWVQYAENTGWWWAYKNVDIVARRPTLLCWEKTGKSHRLHCDTGPAATWRDGWALWSIHGVAVDEQIVMRPQQQTIAEIERERNAEVKRIRIERFGWPRYLAETGAVVLHERRNDVDGTREALMQSNDGQVLLVCACPSTARVYAMRVSREIKLCQDAQRWLRGNGELRVVGAS